MQVSLATVSMDNLTRKIKRFSGKYSRFWHYTHKEKHKRQTEWKKEEEEVKVALHFKQTWFVDTAYIYRTPHSRGIFFVAWY